MILTTESIITDKKEKDCGCGNHQAMPDMGGMYQNFEYIKKEKRKILSFLFL